MKILHKVTHKWCKFNPKFNHKDPNYGTIIDFYLWSCPAPNTAYGSKTFNEYGWKGGHAFKKLKRQITYENKISFATPKRENVLESLKKYGQLDKFTNKETIILVNPSTGEIESLFRAIRNAIAHGSFRVSKYQGEYYYFFENRRNNILRARIVLKSQTLCSWIKIVKKGPYSINRN